MAVQTRIQHIALESDTELERFYDKVDLSQVVDNDDACHLWTSWTSDNGYGRFLLRTHKVAAHRAIYETHYGPIPAGQEVDHICHTRRCVNVEHLRLVTHAQNQQNRTGAAVHSKTGVRGVSWNIAHQKYCVQVQYRGIKHHGGYFDSIDEAEVAAIELRTELFTHNDADFQ